MLYVQNERTFFIIHSLRSGSSIVHSLRKYYSNRIDFDYNEYVHTACLEKHRKAIKSFRQSYSIIENGFESL